MGTGESRESPAELRDCPLRDYSYCANRLRMHRIATARAGRGLALQLVHGLSGAPGRPACCVSPPPEGRCRAHGGDRRFSELAQLRKS